MGIDMPSNPCPFFEFNFEIIFSIAFVDTGKLDNLSLSFNTSSGRVDIKGMTLFREIFIEYINFFRHYGVTHLFAEVTYVCFLCYFVDIICLFMNMIYMHFFTEFSPSSNQFSVHPLISLYG